MKPIEKALLTTKISDNLISNWKEMKYQRGVFSGGYESKCNYRLGLQSETAKGVGKHYENALRVLITLSSQQ
jgi:hypothetical protein